MGATIIWEFGLRCLHFCRPRHRFSSIPGPIFQDPGSDKSASQALPTFGVLDTDSASILDACLRCLGPFARILDIEFSCPAIMSNSIGWVIHLCQRVS